MTSSFRQRQASGKYKVAQLTALAQGIEKNRKEEVVGMTNQAKEQKEVLSDWHKNLTWKDGEELKQLKEFSKTLNDFLSGPVTSGFNLKVQSGINKGRLEHAKYSEAVLANDPKIDETDFSVKEKKVDQLENQVNEQQIKIEKLASSQSDPKEADRIRKNFGFFENHGWKLATLSEAADGYGPHMDNSLLDDSREITFDGRTFAINDTNKSKEEYEAVRDFLFAEYVNKAQADTGLSEGYITTKFIPKLEKIEAAQKKIYYDTLAKEELNDKVEGQFNTTYQALDGLVGKEDITDKDITNAAAAIIVSHTATRPHFKGQEGGMNTAWANAFNSNIITPLIDQGLDSDTIIKILKKAKIDKNGTQVDLFTAMPRHFDEDGIKIKVEKAYNLKIQREEAVANNKGKEAVSVLVQDENFYKLSDTDQAIEINKWKDEFGIHMDPTKMNTELSRLQSAAQREFLNPQQTVAVLNGAKTEGVITHEKLLALNEKYYLDKKTVEEYKDKNLFVSKSKLFSFEIEKETITKANTTVKNSLSGVNQDLFGDKNQEKSVDFGYALTHAEKEVKATAKQLYELALKSGEPISKEQAYSDAATVVARKISDANAVDTQDPTSPYYFNTSTKTFPYFNKPTTSHAIRAQNNAVKNWVQKDILTNGVDGFLTRPNPYINENHLTLTAKTGFKPHPILYDIAQLAGPNVDVWHVLNAYQAQSLGEENVTEPPKEILAAREALSKSGPEAVSLFNQLKNNPNDLNLKTRLFRVVGVDNNGLAKALHEVVIENRTDQSAPGYTGFKGDQRKDNLIYTTAGGELHNTFGTNEPGVDFTVFNHPDTAQDILNAVSDSQGSFNYETDIIRNTGNTIDVKGGNATDYLLANGPKHGLYPLVSQTNTAGQVIQYRFVYKPNHWVSPAGDTRIPIPWQRRPK